MVPNFATSVLSIKSSKTACTYQGQKTTMIIRTKQAYFTDERELADLTQKTGNRTMNFTLVKKTFET